MPNTPSPRPDVEGIEARAKARLEERQLSKRPSKRPTIHELEAILKEDESARVEILPSGEVRAISSADEDIPALIAYIGRLEAVVELVEDGKTGRELDMALAALGEGDGAG